MLYRTIQPSLHLRPFVQEYLLLHFVFDPKASIPVKPFPVRPQQCIVFYLRGGVTAYSSLSGAVTRFPRIAVNGSQVSRLDFQLSRDYLMLAVDFHPGILHHFLRMTLSEAFIDERIDGGALLGSGIEHLYEQMANAKQYEHIIALFEEYLWRRIKQIRFELGPLERLCRFVAQRPAALSVEQMASEACLSISQLERRFAQQIGISPKLFARTYRFYQAFQLKDQHPDLDWLSVALQTGYSDYQHLVKDFKQFAGSTPASLLEAQAKAPERILGLD